jgi:predicted PP-loop superfamily ATPase
MQKPRNLKAAMDSRLATEEQHNEQKCLRKGRSAALLSKLPFSEHLRQVSQVMKVVVLCSGGIDSVTALYWAHRR